MILSKLFFEQSPHDLAISLLGKILRHRYTEPASKCSYWLSAQIIETEAYYRKEKGSHSSLGFTQKRKAMFMPAGTIYMYYARGGDSLNFSAKGQGNAVLIKSGYPYVDATSPLANIALMQTLNPPPNGRPARSRAKLCSGQTLLCKALGLKVTRWNQNEMDPASFYLEDTGYSPNAIIQSTRLGIPKGRDEHLPNRFLDYDFAAYATSNPLTKRKAVLQKDYRILTL
jgi:DNA-3-methyladenine glycosylase|tara:strand:- start:2200 stop:2883 length:684 start_codon:yes stop_codon:yes gene_type:complete